MKIMQKEEYNMLVSEIGQLLEQGRRQAVSIVNTAITQTYWDIGKHIVEYEQKGEERAQYGVNLIKRLSVDLTYKLYFGFVSHC